MNKGHTLTRRAAMAALLVAPVACTAPPSLYRPAGEAIVDPALGSAVSQNTQAHIGRADAIVHLNGRFGQAVPSTVTFPFDSARLTASARAALDRQAAFMREFPEVRFSVTGHTDLVGPEGYNHALGLRRARAVVHYLTRRGVHRSRLDALVSEGETEPVVATAGRAEANRRVVTTVGGFVRGHPSFLDGKYAHVVYRQYVGSAANGIIAEEIAGATATGAF